MIYNPQGARSIPKQTPRLCREDFVLATKSSRQRRGVCLGMDRMSLGFSGTSRLSLQGATALLAISG